jgi:hypothetical protein
MLSVRNWWRGDNHRVNFATVEKVLECRRYVRYIVSRRGLGRSRRHHVVERDHAGLWRIGQCLEMISSDPAGADYSYADISHETLLQ